jgi:hypothetical protein
VLLRQIHPFAIKADDDHLATPISLADISRDANRVWGTWQKCSYPCCGPIPAYYTRH